MNHHLMDVEQANPISPKRPCGPPSIMGIRRGELCELLLDFCMNDLLDLYDSLKDALLYDGIDIGRAGSTKFIEMIMNHVHFEAISKSVDEVMSE